MNSKKAILWTGLWIILAALFNFCIYIIKGQQSALEFFGGYIIEQSLSLDNLFLFLIIFDTFGISTKYQRRILNYGIAGAIILRLIFILMGVTIVEKFHWVLYMFGIILIFSGGKILLSKENETMDFKNSWILKIFGKIIPISKELSGEKFFIRKNNKIMATNLFAVLLLVEISDIIFAIDSIPAIFSMTFDPLIVYTSNIFAILGLRNMYFIIEKAHRSFCYVKHGVAVILIFTGLKLYLLKFAVEIPILLSITIIAAILFISILSSVIFRKKS